MSCGASFLLSPKGDSDETHEVLGVGLAYKYRLPPSILRCVFI